MEIIRWKMDFNRTANEIPTKDILRELLLVIANLIDKDDGIPLEACTDIANCLFLLMARSK